MDIFILVLIVITLWGIKSSGKYFYDDNMRPGGSALSLRGIFAILIFLSHSKQYINIHNSLFNSLFIFQNLFLGQLIVSIFFFYSGFGIMESIKNKPNYLGSFPKKRILKTLLNFDVAICFYLITNLILQRDYSIKDILLSFIGWKDIGNSNWFIFAILIAYLFIYLSSLISKNKNLITLFTSILLFGYCIIISKVQRGNLWCDTILTLPFGMFFSLYYDNIKSFVTKNNTFYLSTIVLSVCLFIVFYLLVKVFNPLTLTHNIVSIIFCFILVLFTYKFQIKNKVLSFLGKHSFNIYIMQRIPMIFLANTFLQSYNVCFVITSFILTIVISLGYNKLCKLINKKLKI